MSEPTVLHEAVRVPGSAITVRAAHAPGPGGQNVNKVATKIDLREATGCPAIWAGDASTSRN